MMPPEPASSLAIVMPVLNEAAGIEAALRALAPLRARGARVVVADGGSADDTLARARRFGGVEVIQAPRGRAAQMNAGALAATGDGVLLFLHADTTLPPDADRLIAQALAGGQQVWGRFDVRIAGHPRMLRVVAACMNVRSRWSGIATGDQALFMTRAAFDAVGGFPEQPLMEDIEMSKRLRTLSRPACLRERVITSGRRWESRGVWPPSCSCGACAGPTGAVPRRRCWRGATNDEARRASPERAARRGLRQGTVAWTGQDAADPCAGCRGRRPAGAAHAGPCAGAGDGCASRRRGAVHEPRPGRCGLARCRMAGGFAVPDQGEGDLGARMARAVHRVTTGPHGHPVLLMGTDCPALTAGIIGEAAAQLARHDAVLVPVADGGYVLLGLRADCPDIFRDMAWSTAVVAAETRRRLAALGLNLWLGPTLNDIDEPADRVHLPSEWKF
jgi:rSAM/selenodomain-associated transferase 2